MSIEAIAPVSASFSIADVPELSRALDLRTPGADFSSMIGDGLNRVDASLRDADAKVRGLVAGDDIPLHDVMISMEKARLDLMLVVEVRNRLVEAYQELNRMQL
jgi:flagellar hook-basal body complex protein FliE